MKDITQEIKRSVIQEVIWSVDLFFVAIDDIKNHGFIVDYWEDEENWARVVYEEDVVAYLWKRYPVIFLERSIAGKFIFLNAFLEQILVDDFTKDQFLVCDDQLEYLFDSGINMSAFTVEDFWFFTNSI